MLLATAVKKTRFLLDETTAQFWTDTMLKSWINEGCWDVARQAQTLWAQDAITAVVTQATYALPTDFLGVHKLTFLITTHGVSSKQFFNLEFRGIKEMDEIWGILHLLPAAYPNAFYIWNDPTSTPGTAWYMGIYPVPSTTGVFTLYYYRKAKTATTTTTPIDVTIGYEDLPLWFAVYRAKFRDRDPTWQEAKSTYDQMLANMIDKTVRFSDQGSQFVSDANASWPVYMYTSPTGW